MLDRQFAIVRIAGLFTLLAVAGRAQAHPASAIVVDEKGQVYFVYTGQGLMKIDAGGKVSTVYASRGGHWMALDAGGVFARRQPKYFRRVTPDGVKPALVFADGGAPLVVHPDGNLYYGSWDSKTDPFAPGALTVTRMSPDGTCTNFAPSLEKTLADMNEGVTGVAVGPDKAIYVASPSALLKVTTDGRVSTVARGIVVDDCEWNPPDHNQADHRPWLRGITVAPDLSVYAATTACRRVVRITPDGKPTVVMKSEAPWSPTDVALHDGSVYVLEYTNANGGHDERWVPRVRKLDPSGKITTLADLSKEPPPGR